MGALPCQRCSRRSSPGVSDPEPLPSACLHGVREPHPPGTSCGVRTSHGVSRVPVDAESLPLAWSGRQGRPEVGEKRPPPAPWTEAWAEAGRTWRGLPEPGDGIRAVQRRGLRRAPQGGWLGTQTAGTPRGAARGFPLSSAPRGIRTRGRSLRHRERSRCHQQRRASRVEGHQPASPARAPQPVLRGPKSVPHTRCRPRLSFPETEKRGLRAPGRGTEPAA